MGGFGISAADDLLVVEDLFLVRQICTAVSVQFDDQAVADFFDAQVDAGLPPLRFARIWVHTHPGDSAEPTATDEDTFQRCFGNSDWAVMFILSRGGRVTARLQFNVGPRLSTELSVELDFSRPFPGSKHQCWGNEYDRCVVEEIPLKKPSRPNEQAERCELCSYDEGDAPQWWQEPWPDGAAWPEANYQEAAYAADD